MSDAIQLNAPAGNLPCLTAAVDAGADAVYIGFRSATNLRNLPGLNFSVEEAAEGVRYAHRQGTLVFVTVNTYPTDRQLESCYRAVDQARDVEADAVIAADLAVLQYARDRHPDLDVHLSCSAGAADSASIRFYCEEFGVSCVVLPRVLSLDEIAALRGQTDVSLEVMVFGVLCANYEGRCHLSSFITGKSANSVGACAPAEFVGFEETPEGRTLMKLNGLTIGDFGPAEPATYPTPCKGTYVDSVHGEERHAFQDPCCLNAMPLLPQLAEAGVDWVKIEGRQRSFSYVRTVTSAWRSAIDDLSEGTGSDCRLRDAEMESIMEGSASTLGALRGG